MTSVQTEALRDLATRLTAQSDALSGNTRATVAALAMPKEAYPLFSLAAWDDYEKVRSGIENVTIAVQDILETTGTALTRVAAHYEQMEQEHSESFTYDNG
ncbi:hypothetical protein [Actinoplanes sp. NPDC051851]|uniref:hypothetical protein n=1 Tax=Actinoplanes sp. NPDC051851 TaxID=3154753 RepID=UPI00343F42C9